MTKEVFLTTMDGIELKYIDLPLSAWEIAKDDIVQVKVFPAAEYTTPIFFFYENAEVFLHEQLNNKI